MVFFSASKRVQATFLNDANNTLNRRGASTLGLLTKALFNSEPHRAHPVVEPHASSHVIVELTNDQIIVFGTSKPESSVSGRVRSTES